ncbi:MAG: hypothetical protein JXQ68_04840 [Campylobacterales bacterium]|nr:hypothetical protein [Campylobacterales bacterium]
MKYISSLIMTFFALLALSGCASHENFVKKYNGWIGKDINIFIDKYGYPDSSFEAPNGNTVYVYEEEKIESYPEIGFGWGLGNYGNRVGWGMGGYHTVTQKTCKLFLEVSRNNKIVKWNSRGNSCIASDPTS